MSNEQIEKILANTKTSMEMEGFIIDEKLIENGRKMLLGEKSRQDCIEEYRQLAMRLSHEV